ncbi:MAG: helix-turn-helix domain-containing protein [Terriglobia bacterium]
MPFASVTDHVNIATPELSPVFAGTGALLTVHDVAEFLRVPPSWVYERTRRRGKDRLPHIKVGKYLRFRPSDVEIYLETLRRG